VPKAGRNPRTGKYNPLPLLLHVKPPDSRKPDSRPPDSRPPDSRPPDSRPPDSRPPDSRPPDSKLPDGSGPLPPTQTPRLVSCSTQIVDLGEKSLPFQKIFDDRSALGYDPLWMDTFVEGGGESLSYIWVPNAISGWGSWWGQTLANYQTKITGYQVGYQIVNVESLPTGGWLHYGMLVHAPAVPFVHAEEQTEAAYASYVSGLVGYRPVAVAYVEWNSQMLVTSAHRKWSTGVTATAEHLAPTAFATLNVSQNAKNLYLTHLNAYTQGGQIRFSGVWNDVAYTSALFLHGLEKTALQAEIGTQCSTKQLPLRLVTGYENGAVVQYAAFWAK
jgi:hypothetical protein